MPRMIWTKSIFGKSIHVQEGTILTQPAWEQWNGWYSKIAKTLRRRPGLREQYSAQISDLERDIDYIDQMIDAGVTYKDLDGEIEKVIDEFEEECFYEELEDLRNSLNDTLKKYTARRPLKRRIELAQQMIDLNSEPELKAVAQDRIDAMKKRLGEGE
jgi:hypothetical protein